MEPDQQANNPTSKSKLRTLVLAIALVAVVALTVGLLIWAKPSSKKALAPAYKYNKTDTYTQAYKDGGFYFVKPVELVTPGPQGGPQFQLVQEKNGSSTAPYLAYVSGGFVTTDAALTDQQLFNLNGDLLTTSNNPYYATVTKPIKQFLLDRLPKNWTLKMDHAGVFRTVNVTKNAWLIKYTASDPLGKNEPLGGEAIYAVVGNRYYSFTINATGNNWTANGGTWETITDSLKLQ